MVGHWGQRWGLSVKGLTHPCPSQEEIMQQSFTGFSDSRIQMNQAVSQGKCLWLISSSNT